MPYSLKYILLAVWLLVYIVYYGFFLLGYNIYIMGGIKINKIQYKNIVYFEAILTGGKKIYKQTLDELIKAVDIPLFKFNLN